jgi:hypothetical protein
VNAPHCYVIRTLRVLSNVKPISGLFEAFTEFLGLVVFCFSCWMRYIMMNTSFTLCVLSVSVLLSDVECVIL